MTYLQKKRLSLAVLVLLPFFGSLFFFDKGEAKGNEHSIAMFTYKTFTTYKSPRIQQQCWDNFIGVGYANKKEWICRSLWNEWTREMLVNSPGSPDSRY